jgi:hypothetical protein
MHDRTVGGKLKGCLARDWETAEGQLIGIFLLYQPQEGAVSSAG